MTRHHSVLDVAALCLVGLAGVVTLMVSVSSWNPPMFGYSLGLLGVTAIIWSGGRPGSIGTVVGLLAVAAGVRGAPGLLAVVVLLAWAGERATRFVRARESARDNA